MTPRDYTAADYDALVAHLVEFQDGERLLEPGYAPGVEIAHSYLPGIFAACLTGARPGRHRPGRVAVAEEGGAVVAYTGFYETIVSCMTDGRVVEVCDLYVAPAHRGRGIGTRLLAEAEAFARAGCAAPVAHHAGPQHEGPRDVRPLRVPRVRGVAR